MLSGFNTNLRHRGVLFHVQTEDSGRANPHIISHLFHGGNILASRKSDYRELLDSGEIADAVRQMMESQHKDMLRNLLRGGCDGQILERLGPDVFDSEPSAGQAVTKLASEPEPEPVLEAELEAVELEAVGLEPGLEPGLDGAVPEIAAAVIEAPVQAALPEAVTQPVVAPPAVEESSKEKLNRAFGDGVVSQKPLDEVVLDFLVANARKRKRPPS